MINILEEISVSRYNGGWTKTVTGLDKTKNNGYSILGEFTTIHKGMNQLQDGLYLDNNKDGSRKNQTSNYTLFSVKGDSLAIVKKVEDGGRDWALHLWEEIEKYFGEAESPLAKYTDEEILAEAKRRGLMDGKTFVSINDNFDT